MITRQVAEVVQGFATAKYWRSDSGLAVEFEDIYVVQLRQENEHQWHATLVFADPGRLPLQEPEVAPPDRLKVPPHTHERATISLGPSGDSLHWRIACSPDVNAALEH